MIKFLIVCTVFLLLYLGFSTIEKYDSLIQFVLLDYEVETTLFTILAIFLTTQLVLMICLKIIFFVFNTPSFLKKRWRQQKLQQVNRKLLNVLAELLMGNRKKSLGMINKLVPELDDDNKEVVNLIRAEAEAEFDKKTQYLRNLIDKKHYSIYAAKKLAEIFYKNTHYKQAEECALKAFNEDDTDTELMLLLIRIYASLGVWSKLVFIVSKLQRADIKLLDKHSSEIASFYYTAAKSYLQSSVDEEALSYLESALVLRPDYLEALNLYTEISINMKNTASVLKILKVAFSAKPSFELARMYIVNSRSSAEAAYGSLSNMAEVAKYPDLFLALAAYLGLSNKIAEIRDHKLILQENFTKE